MFNKTVKDVVKTLKQAAADLTQIQVECQKKGDHNVALIERLEEKNIVLAQEAMAAHQLVLGIDAQLAKVS